MLIRWIGILIMTAGFCGGATGRDVATTLAPAVKFAEARHALVIGNANYTYGALKNPVNDARAMARELSQAGFEVMLLEDATQAAMQRAIRRFGDAIQQGAVGLFYYAGHGMQVKGRNFLVPVNADIDREYEIEYNAVDVNMVLSMMDTARNPLNIVILDACRNNPFARSFRISAAGLAQMDSPAGTFIAFATSPGAVAADGTGSNGVYTKHLLEQIRVPGQKIEQLFKQVRIGVIAETRGEQTPWESSSLRGEFLFVPDARPAAQAPPPADLAAIEELLRRDREARREETEKQIRDALERQRKEFAQQAVRVIPEPAVASPAPAKTEPAIIASVAPQAITGAIDARLPQAGDRWTYRLVQPRQKGAMVDHSYEVLVVAASTTGVLDRASIDGGQPAEWAHPRGPYFMTQGLALFSPYLSVFEEMRVGAPLGKIVLRGQTGCQDRYSCNVTGRVVAREELRTSAGRFDAYKVVIEQEWYPGQPAAYSADMWARRTLTVWYSPQLKRAIKYSSRVASGTPPIDANFDLELLSYQLNQP
jgi:uncharacterized caspase-like protein